MADPTNSARSAVQQLLSGLNPNVRPPADYGEWAEVVQALVDAYNVNGTVAVRQTFETLARAHRPLLALVAGNTTDAGEPLSRNPCPPLPPEASAIYEHLAPCGQWLDDYIAFQVRAFPMTPRSFHEAAGLFVVSLAIARRACVRVSTGQLFPNLYLLYIAPSGTRRKSTAMHGVHQLLSAAGMLHLLLPQRMTPEAMILRMSVGKVQQHADAAKQARWLEEQAFAGQRGWMRDEVSALFSSMRRDFNSELLELVLDLYDCKERAGESATVTRGDDVIERAYLSLFGAANPDTMAPHLANRSHWLNGLWARFALLTPGPDEPYTWQFYHDALALPPALVTGLRRVYDLFPKPQAEIKGAGTEEGSTTPFVAITNVQPPTSIGIAPEAWAAWETYCKATGWTMTLPDAGAGTDLAPELQASYARLGTHLIKVAMLLAVLDGEDARDLYILPEHLARAQQIVERWRACLHSLWGEQSGSEDSRLMTRILRYLQRAGMVGMTCRDLCHLLGSKARETTEALEILSRAGRVTVLETLAANGRRVELWVASDQLHSDAGDGA
jgi:hypothetical protein